MTSCGWTPDFEQLQFPFGTPLVAGSCGWTPDFEQLQCPQRQYVGKLVAAGLRILNSYNNCDLGLRVARVAAGLRILNSYNSTTRVRRVPSVAAGLRILNSYNKLF